MYLLFNTEYDGYYVVVLQELCDGFLDYLWKRVQNPSIQSVYRQTAVTYMGSFLARAKFVNIRYVHCVHVSCITQD